MLTGKTLQQYCKLALSKGVNLQKGQGLEIVCPTEKSDIAVALASEGYKMGAEVVNVRWENDQISRLAFENASMDKLTTVPKWVVENRNYLVKEGFCYVAISAEDPSAFSGVDEKRIAAYSKARSKALKFYSDTVMSNGIRWCVISAPTKEWAKQVFPNSENPLESLSLAIEKAMRLDGDNTISNWEKHIENLSRHADFLNEKNFDYLHFTNGLGTDLKVGLSEGHIWQSAKEMAKDGIEFIANLPTEEVFTAPHRLRVDGVVHSALPLSFNGNIVDNFTIEFKKGKVVSFSAEKGYETLKHLIDTDEGTRRLGEVALIGKRSPIFESGILFYNTLFDENASCHLALGKAYPPTIKEGSELSISELKKKGANDSIEHVDFMIGTPDLNIVGVDKNGNKTPIFIDGDWAI